jgi:hypothetical protein
LAAAQASPGAASASLGRIEIVLFGVQHRGQCTHAAVELIHGRTRQTALKLLWDGASGYLA